MGGTYSMHDGAEKLIQKVQSINLKGRDHLGTVHRWEGNTEMDIKGIGCEEMD
jgi:hypothetical protein